MDRLIYTAMTGASAAARPAGDHRAQPRQRVDRGYRAETTAFRAVPVQRARRRRRAPSWRFHRRRRLSRRRDPADRAPPRRRGGGRRLVRGAGTGRQRGLHPQRQLPDQRGAACCRRATASGAGRRRADVVPPDAQVSIGADGTVSAEPIGPTPKNVISGRAAQAGQSRAERRWCAGGDGLFRSRRRRAPRPTRTSGWPPARSRTATSTRSAYGRDDLPGAPVRDADEDAPVGGRQRPASQISCSPQAESHRPPTQRKVAMIRSLWIAKTGLDAQQTQLDVISNNLANVSTNGFKRARAVFEDLLYQTLRQPGAQSSQQTQLPSGLQLGTGVRPVATERIFTQGNLQQTGNALDVAINGQRLLPDPDARRHARLHPRRLASSSTPRASWSPPAAIALSPAITIPAERAVDHHRPRRRGHRDPGRAVGDADAGRHASSSPPSSTRPACRARGENLYIETASSGTPTPNTPGQQRCRHAAARAMSRPRTSTWSRSW